MLSRRSFLLSAGALAMTQLLGGCTTNEAALSVQLLAGSIPPQLLREFRKQKGKENKLLFQPVTQLQDLLSLLESWKEKEEGGKTDQSWWKKIPGISKKPPTVADLITLDNYLLTDGIKKQLIEPLSLENLPNWGNLPALWQNLVLRRETGELAPEGKVWGAPYRTGYTAIAYREDKFEELGWIPSDWGDLWRRELRSRFSLLNHPREVIGLTLKKLGYSYNTQNLAAVSSLKSDLITLNQQVKFFSSDTYLQPLILGDTWLAIGWSTDIVPLLPRYPNIKIVVPAAGTALWADIWVKPKSANINNTLVDQWIDFCWQPEFARLISLFTDAISPVSLSLKSEESSNILLTPEIITKSDFIQPLGEKVEAEYLSLWKEIRKNNE